MKLLINDKEITYFLLDLIDYTPMLKQVPNDWPRLGDFILTLNPKMLGEKNRQKLKEKIHKFAAEDAREFYDKVRDILKTERRKNFFLVKNNTQFFIDKLGKDNILKAYRTSKKDNFVKGVGLKLNSKSVLIRRNEFNSAEEDCLIRNTVGNENLLISKLDNKYPFWFIDSGYTNFLEGKKKTFHRIVRNHLHYGDFFEAPADRLGMFKEFPHQWRTDGDKILIIEPGSLAAGIFHVDLKTWKYQVAEELRKYTDKRIVFRRKNPKKERSRLYDVLLNEDFYCVVNINSNAATEAVWAGVPIITLDKHITNPIARSKLCDINHLLRPNVAPWLCMLSYSQFTYPELVNGTAVNIIKQYHR